MVQFSRRKSLVGGTLVVLALALAACGRANERSVLTPERLSAVLPAAQVVPLGSMLAPQLVLAPKSLPAAKPLVLKETQVFDRSDRELLSAASAPADQQSMSWTHAQAQLHGFGGPGCGGDD